MSLTTSYLGLKLQHPFVLGASPLTGDLDSVRRIVDAGCAAVVMHSLFEERIPDVPAGAVERLAGIPPELTGSVHFRRWGRVPLGPDEYLEQLRRIKAAVGVPVIGSLNGTRADGWLESAPLLEQAGADAIELNFYYLAAALDDSPRTIERDIEAGVRKIKEQVRIPVAVKLLPFYTAFAGLAAALDTAGADGLVLFNRFYQPDIDVETLEVTPSVRLSTSAELLLRLHWLAILSGRVTASLAAVGGIHTVTDGVKALLSGADAVQLVSAVLQQGPNLFHEMEEGLRQWMTRHECDSIDAFRGRASLRRIINPSAFERTNYLRVLQAWGE